MRVKNLRYNTRDRERTVVGASLQIFLYSPAATEAAGSRVDNTALVLPIKKALTSELAELELLRTTGSCMQHDTGNMTFNRS